MASKYTITYRCGHQKQNFIYVSKEYIPDRLAEFARILCSPCQIAEEQRQFEEALSLANPVYNVTDQNGCLITATFTQPRFCQITIRYEGQVPFYNKELEISQVTTELYRRNWKHLYWSGKNVSKPSPTSCIDELQ